jgi:hypothetical protein
MNTGTVRLGSTATIWLLWAWASSASADEARARAVFARSAAAAAGAAVDVERRPLGDGIAEYSMTLTLGPAAADQLRLHRVVRERAPWRPFATRHALVALHGDFSTFDSNFVGDGSGLAVFLAGRGLDVWGIDRRWTLVRAGTTELTGLRTQGFAAAVADTELALAVATQMRAAEDDCDAAPLALVGFSRGGQLAYATALQETTLPAELRQVGALAILDIHYRIAPADETLRLAACKSYQDNLARLNGGTLAADDSIFDDLGRLALAAPAGPSPVRPGLTNAQALERVAGQTYLFEALRPNYHLNAVTLADGVPTGFVYAPYAGVASWFAAAPPFQSQAEVTDGDAIWCGAGAPQPIAGELASITTPLLYIGAAGGVGAGGLYTTTLVGSDDVTTRVVRRLPPGQESADFGHGDLLFSPDAAALAWGVLADWLHHH